MFNVVKRRNLYEHCFSRCLTRSTTWSVGVQFFSKKLLLFILQIIFYLEEAIPFSAFSTRSLVRYYTTSLDTFGSIRVLIAFYKFYHFISRTLVLGSPHILAKIIIKPEHKLSVNAVLAQMFMLIIICVYACVFECANIPSTFPSKKGKRERRKLCLINFLKKKSIQNPSNVDMSILN